MPAGNPLANIFVIIVGLLAISASIVLGFFAFIIVGSIVLIMAAVVGLRVWWFKRQLGSTMQSESTARKQQGAGVIEGEYRVVDDESKDA